MQWFNIALTWFLGLSTLSSWFANNQYLVHASNVPQEATVFALIYGFPLYAYPNLTLSIGACLGGFLTNTFCHQKELVNASFTDIVLPNVDTLYSEALVDVSAHDVVVTIPTFPSGRFYVFAFYDLYGNNFINLGTVKNTTRGRYLVSYRPSNPGSGPGDNSFDGYIYAPTPYGALLLRIQVDNTSDVQTVNDLQVKFKLTTTETSQPQVAPTLTKSLLFDGLSGNETTQLLQLTGRLAPYNPPEVQRDVSLVNSTLTLAGLTGDSYTTPSGVNLLSAAAEAAFVASNISGTEKYFVDLGNHWSQLRAEFSGDFKSYYAVRAFVTENAYLQLTADQALYPSFNGSAQLFANSTYQVTFHGKPQVTGFWSLTVYTATGRLVPNPLNRYALGDRSNITYSNGSYVYGSHGSPADSTAPFSFYLQTQDITPPEKYYPNWLPTPSGNETFNIRLRWYGPTEELESDYEYPSVTVIDALVGT